MSDYMQEKQGIGRMLHSFMAVILAVTVAFAFSGISASQFAYADNEISYTAKFVVPGMNPAPTDESLTANDSGDGTASVSLIDFKGKFNGYKLVSTTIGDGTPNKDVDTDITVAQGNEVTFTYEPIEYTITYAGVDGATNDNPTTYTILDKVTITSLDRDGYYFDGWAYEGQTTPQQTVTIDKGSTGNRTYTATWTQLFTVTFDSDGGSAVADQTIKNGEKATKPANPTKDEYTFERWLLGDSPYDFDTPVTKDITLEASWKATTTEPETKTISYTVNYTGSDNNPASYTREVKVNADVNDLAVQEADISKAVTGYTIKNITLANGTAVKAGDMVPNGSIITVTYEKVTTPPPAKTFTVTFNSDGGSAVATQTVNENEKATKPANPTKSGYIFEGWTLNGKAYDFDTPVTDNITLTASWKAETPAPAKTFTVTFDSDGGSTVKAQSVKDGAKATKPASPTKDGYTFEGWTLNGKAYDFSTPVTGNITLTASWKAEEKTGDWVQSGNRWWYEYSDGDYPKNEWLQIDGKYYHFNSAGWMQTGWLQTDQSVNSTKFDSKKWFYLDASGSAHSGWLLSGGAWYYLLPASDNSVTDGQYTMVASPKKGEFVVKTIKGKEYCFASSGAMGTGWIKDSGSWFYYDKSSGAQVSSKWIFSNGKWYWLDEYGVMATSSWVDGDKYYVNSQGVMLTGWNRVGRNSSGKYTTDINGAPAWYYFKPSGAVVKNDWLFSGGKWYWLTDDGTMAQSEFVTSKKKDYYLNENGTIATGWKQISGSWYYFKSTGEKVVSNWVQSSGKWYWMNDDGVMATSEWTDDGKYYLDASGAMVTGWKRIAENSDGIAKHDKDGGYAWYYFNKSGSCIKDSWVKGGANWYWLTSDGSLAEGEWVDYDKYYVNDKGVWLPDYKKDSDSSDDEASDE